MDVVNAEQAEIAEEAGAVAVMALERVPADIRADGGVARMSHPDLIQEIIEISSIPVMAKARIGHNSEARILEHLGVDMIDESEVLTPADPYFHIHKESFEVPFVCGATSVSEAVRRVTEGAAMIRTKGEAGTGNIVAAVTHAHLLNEGIAAIVDESSDLEAISDLIATPYQKIAQQLDTELRSGTANTPFGPINDLTSAIRDTLSEIRTLKRLPVVTFSAGGIATPADAALMMQHGMDGVFVGSGIFKSETPAETAEAIVRAAHAFDDPAIVTEACRDAGAAMRGIELEEIPEHERLERRGW